MEHRRAAATIFAALALLAAAALFIARGPLRAHNDSGDLKGRYLATRAWVHGADPYNAATLAAVARQSRVSGNSEPYVHEIYPPSTFVILAPLALFDWPAARDVWVGVMTLLVLAGIAALVWLAGKRLLVLAFLLAFAPLHTALALGNVSAAVAAMVFIAVLAWVRGRDVAAAVILGIAIALKPQLALPFLFVPFAARRWRSLVLAAAIPLVILGVGVLRVAQFAPAWPAELAANYARVFAVGDVNDPTAANPYRFNLVNLPTLLYSMTSDPAVVQWTTMAISAALALLLLRFAWRSDDVLLVAAATAALSMLPLYRRTYDAAILLLPFAWCVPRLRTERSARVVLIALVPFLLPGAAMLRRFAGHAAITQTRLWNAVVMPHAIWCEIAIAIALLIQLRKRS